MHPAANHSFQVTIQWHRCAKPICFLFVFASGGSPLMSTSSRQHWGTCRMEVYSLFHNITDVVVHGSLYIPQSTSPLRVWIAHVCTQFSLMLQTPCSRFMAMIHSRQWLSKTIQFWGTPFVGAPLQRRIPATALLCSTSTSNFWICSIKSWTTEPSAKLPQANRSLGRRDYLDHPTDRFSGSQPLVSKASKWVIPSTNELSKEV